MICGAFYPNFFVSSDMDESEVMKTMSGHDPFSTVMVRTANKIEKNEEIKTVQISRAVHALYLY